MVQIKSLVALAALSFAPVHGIDLDTSNAGEFSGPVDQFLNPLKLP